MNWDDYRFFLQLAKSEKLKIAAQTLKVDQATVGRRIQSLEESLNTRLFDKTSQGFHLTESGRVIFETISKIESDFLSVERISFGKNNLLQGHIKIAMPGALANHGVIPKLKSFLEKYSHIELQFLTGPEVLNLSKREADLAIRLVRPQQKDLIIKKMGHLTLELVGHTDWIARMKKSGQPISTWPFIGLYEFAQSELETKLIKELNFEPHYQMRSSAWSSVHCAVEAELGMGFLPSFMVNKNKKLKKIPDLSLKPNLTYLWLVVHPDVYHNLKLKVFIDELIEICKTISL